MKATLLLTLLGSGIALLAESPVKVVRELRTGSIRYSVLGGRLNEAQVATKAVALLGSPDVTLGRLVVYASERDSVLAAREEYLEGCGLEELRTFLKSNRLLIEPHHCLAMSEAIKIGSSILLRTVDSQCQNTQKLLLGNSNPLSLRSMGTRPEVLAVSVRSRIQATAASGPPIVDVFVRTDSKLTTELAEDILKQLKNATGAPEMMLALRNDEDFVRHCSYSPPFLFDTSASADLSHTKRATAGGEVTCVALDPWPVRCSVYEGTQQPVGRDDSLH